MGEDAEEGAEVTGEEESEDVEIDDRLSVDETPSSAVADDVSASSLEVVVEVASASGASVVEEGDIGPAFPPPAVPMAKISESQ